MTMVFRRLLLLILAMFPMSFAWATMTPLSIERADYVIESVDGPARPPGDGVVWQPTELAQRVPNPGGELVRVWLRMPFRLDEAPPTPLAVMFPRMYSGGVVLLNDVPVGEVEGSSRTRQGHSLRPYMMMLPLQSLRQGENVLTIGVTSRYARVGIGPPVIGALAEIEAMYLDRFFWEYSVALIAVWLLVVGGLFMLVIWLRRRSEVLYAIFALGMIGWGLRSLFHVVPSTPIEMWPYWRALFYLATACGDIFVCIFLLRSGGFVAPRLERAAMLYGTVAPILMLVAGEHFLTWETWWYAGLLPLDVFALYIMARSAWRERTWVAMSLAAIVGGGILLAVGHDAAILAGLLPNSSIFIAHIVAPAVIGAMTVVPLGRFIEALSQVENMNVMLARRIAEREAELGARHEELRHMEAAQASASERQRIMQDMHDGLGSQLLSSLALVEAGGADQRQVAQALRECIDDMRLVIDALSPDDNDLLSALGSLRFRLQPRLQAAGIALEWRLDCAEDALALEPRQGLAALRIVQEGIANVLKHAGATRLVVHVSVEERAVSIRIADNGCGLIVDRVDEGRGLGNMRRRAAGIGAALNITSSGMGTEVLLALPR